MGYTHYWTPKAATPTKWDEYVATCKKLHKALPTKTNTAGGYHSDDEIRICDGLGEGKPDFNGEGICFNGDDERGLSHETFSITPKGVDWNFCKTARKPYDLLVCACLIAAHEILGYEVSSDGGFGDWKPAIEFYLKTIYAELPDKEGLKLILPDFLFENIKSLSVDKKEYTPYDYLKSLFVVQ